MGRVFLRIHPARRLPSPVSPASTRLPSPVSSPVSHHKLSYLHNNKSSPQAFQTQLCVLLRRQGSPRWPLLPCEKRAARIATVRCHDRHSHAPHCPKGTNIYPRSGGTRAASGRQTIGLTSHRALPVLLVHRGRRRAGGPPCSTPRLLTVCAPPSRSQVRVHNTISTSSASRGLSLPSSSIELSVLGQHGGPLVSALISFDTRR